MDFGSDNEAGVRPEIMQAILEANTGAVPSYGEDPITHDLREQFSVLFETDVQVEPVLTGTAANAIGLTRIIPPHGAAVCHAHAHIMHEECGAVEFFSGGKLLAVGGDNGKLDPDALETALRDAANARYHSNRVTALSITQATEYGTVYSPAELTQLTCIAHQFDLNVHMDGARIANAAASLNCRLADITWKAGVDLVSFGTSKNGTLGAEALVVFGNPEWNRDIKHSLKQSGQLLSKARFLSAQLGSLYQAGQMA